MAKGKGPLLKRRNNRTFTSINLRGSTTTTRKPLRDDTNVTEKIRLPKWLAVGSIFFLPKKDTDAEREVSINRVDHLYVVNKIENIFAF